MSDKTLTFRRLGRQDYTEVWNMMKAFTESRTPSSPDAVWSVEHSPIFTQGQGGRPEHLLCAGDIPVIQTDRGGQITYHGPGQLVMYVLIDLIRKRVRIREFVSILEQSVIAMLRDYGITATSHTDAPGVYVNEAKICSIGLKVKRGRTYHGIALNVDMDLEPFSRINPCGFKNLQMTQMKALTNAPLAFEAIEQKIIHHGLQALHYDTVLES